MYIVRLVNSVMESNGIGIIRPRGGIYVTPALAQDGQDSQNYLDAIRAALRTQVSDILRLNMAQLSSLPQDAIYDQVLNDPQLLIECFQVFRNQPDLFRKVVMRPDKRPVTSDQDPLLCGRTLNQVVTLIVRASAKRYFRATLPPPPPPRLVTPPKGTLVEQAAVRLKLKPPPPPPVVIRHQGKADHLYTAFRQNLLYEWQVPLIPGYATLELPTVTRLGERILDLRETSQIEILAAEGLTPEGYLPLLLSDAKRLRGPDGGLDANALSDVFIKLNLDALFPDLVDTALRRAVSQISCVDPRAVEQLLPVLELNIRSVAVFLFTAFHRMGEKAFRQALGPHCALWAVQKMAKYLESCRPWPRSLPGMKQASERALAYAFDLDTGLPAKDAPRAAAPAAPATKPAPAAITGAAKKPAPAASAAPAKPKQPDLSPVPGTAARVDDRASRKAAPISASGRR